jgi:pyridinium-3,5-biscarboxylic acid mononucleotide sulfurtransferase
MTEASPTTHQMSCNSLSVKPSDCFFMHSFQSTEIPPAADALVSWFDHLAGRQCIVAFSGGVDSAVVAKAGTLSTSIELLLATGDSPSLARQELRDAQTIAELIGATHLLVSPAEHQNSDYQRNDGKRCYHCKSHLFATLRSQFPQAVIVTGTNADDLNDYRPGLQAANENHVRSPLAELGYDKTTVRQLAKFWGLHIADKPASPCLASRIAYGVEVTVERLDRIEKAEVLLREIGMVEFRVRLHAGELARIEVTPDQIVRLASELERGRLVTELKALGFRFVTLDLAGFSSGSLNQLVQIGTSTQRICGS